MGATPSEHCVYTVSHTLPHTPNSTCHLTEGLQHVVSYIPNLECNRQYICIIMYHVELWLKFRSLGIPFLIQPGLKFPNSIVWFCMSELYLTMQQFVSSFVAHFAFIANLLSYHYKLYNVVFFTHQTDATNMPCNIRLMTL